MRCDRQQPRYNRTKNEQRTSTTTRFTEFRFRPPFRVRANPQKYSLLFVINSGTHKTQSDDVPLVSTRTCLVFSCLLLFVSLCCGFRWVSWWAPIKCLSVYPWKDSTIFCPELGARGPTLGPLSFRICKGLSRGRYQRTIYTNFGFHTLNLAARGRLGKCGTQLAAAQGLPLQDVRGCECIAEEKITFTIRLKLVERGVKSTIKTPLDLFIVNVCVGRDERGCSVLLQLFLWSGWRI